MITETEREQVALDTLITLVNDIYRQEKDFITASQVVDFIELTKKTLVQSLEAGEIITKQGGNNG